LKSLTEEARAAFDLDVLRPPTFEKLAETLRRAHATGKPYQIVHFDGDSGFFDMEKVFAQARREEANERAYLARNLGLDPEGSAVVSPETLYPNPPRAGARGYLLFEGTRAETSERFVDGPELGALLTNTDVSFLVLNSREATLAAPELDRRVRAWGSLAQEVMDAGAAGVVAMRYNVYVDTAAQFVADLYVALAQGQTLGEAVTLGRKQLHASPLRELGGDPVPLQDWLVPVVYEARPLALVPRQKEGSSGSPCKPALGRRPE